MIYDGMSAQVAGAFTNDAGIAADPAGLLFSLKDPAEAVTTYDQDHANVVHGGPGSYTLSTPPLTRGTWVWQLESTGAFPRITGGAISVWPDPISEHPYTVLARQRLLAMIDFGADPPLTVDEVELLLSSVGRVDIDGLAPDDDGWVPTYALGLAAAEAWTWKAGRVAARVDIADEAAKLSRSQAQKAFLVMAQMYRTRPISVVVLNHPIALQRVYSEVDAAWRPLMPGSQGHLHQGPPYLSPLALPGAVERMDNTA